MRAMAALFFIIRITKFFWRFLPLFQHPFIHLLLLSFLYLKMIAHHNPYNDGHEYYQPLYTIRVNPDHVHTRHPTPAPWPVKAEVGAVKIAQAIKDLKGD